MADKLMDLIARNDELAGRTDRHWNSPQSMVNASSIYMTNEAVEHIVSLHNDWPALSAALKRAVEVLTILTKIEVSDPHFPKRIDEMNAVEVEIAKVASEFAGALSFAKCEARALLAEWGVEAGE